MAKMTNNDKNAENSGAGHCSMTRGLGGANLPNPPAHPPPPGRGGGTPKNTNECPRRMPSTADMAQGPSRVRC